MKTLNLVQGSPEWIATRSKFFTASEAAPMLGQSEKVKRNELLHMKATGTEREFSEWVQRNLLDKGHEVEAMARVIVEARLGEDLYPSTGVLEVDELPLLASFDGITMLEDVCWENKLWNAALVDYIQTHNDAPATHWPQLEQQLLTCGADRVMFTVTDGTEENFVSIWYQSKPERRDLLIRGWKQFAEDLANYVPTHAEPAPVAAAIMELPALVVNVEGRVVSSNLDAFRSSASAFIQGIKTDLQTDQDFADAEKTVKFCSDGESKLELVKSQALAQTASIDTLFRTIDLVKEELRAKRLELEKLVKSCKEAIRTEIIMKARQALADHLNDLDKQIGNRYMPDVPADFAGAIKGKKTLASLQDAADTELARAKVAAGAIADKILANLKTLKTLSGGRAFLFADEATIVHKAPDDLAMLIKSRIDAHDLAERQREQEAQAAQAQPPLDLQPSILEQVKPASPSSISKAKPKGNPTLRLGMINDRLGFTVTAQLLATLGFPAHSEGAARLYHEEDFIPICGALARHVAAVAANEEAKAA